MLGQLAAVVAPIFVAAAVGYVWSRTGRRYEDEFVRRVVMYVGTPCLIVSTIGQAEVDTVSLARIGGACLATVLVTALVFGAILRLARQDLRVALPPLVFPNNGNMGLPLALFAFGEEGLALALAWFVVMALSHFTLGVAIASGTSRWRDSLESPIVWSAVVAVGLQITGTGLPAWVANTVDLLGGLTIPLMLITLGASLAGIRVRALGGALGLAVLRLAGGLGAGLAVAFVLGLDGVARDVVVLQAAMPAAVFNYLIAQQFGRSPELVASVVVTSTLLSFATLPLLIAALLG